MRITFLDRFITDMRALSTSQRGQVFDVILVLPKIFGSPHLHAGVGLRKLHSSGVWGARVGLNLRLVFGFAEQTLTFRLAGSHDDVRRYVKTL